MASDEREFVRWLAHRVDGYAHPVRLGIGDDMALLDVDAGQLLVTSDVLVDGTHFDLRRHDLDDVGRKAARCSLSDCAAMAVRPLAATVSLVLPRTMPRTDAEALMGGLIDACAEYETAVIGGDTATAQGPLTIDVTMLATSYREHPPVLRSGAKAGDAVYVTGQLGGSALGRHLTFQPRIKEAHRIANTLGPNLHSMIDVTDGTAIDADRLAEASRVGIVLDEVMLLRVASDAAALAAAQDGRSVLEHVLGDGEDFELLLTAEPGTTSADELGLYRIGGVSAEPGLRLRSVDGALRDLPPTGYQHL